MAPSSEVRKPRKALNTSSAGKPPTGVYIPKSIP